MATVIDRDGARRADLAAIHIAKKALAWDEDTYRDVMFTVCRVRSSALLDFTGRKTFLAHLQACQRQMGGAGTTVAPARKQAPWSARHRQIWSLWQQLADALLVQDRTRKALDAWVKRQTGVDRMEWANGPQLDALIDSAKGWLARSGAKPGAK